MLSGALQRNAKHEARLSNISDLLLQRIDPEVARDFFALLRMTIAGWLSSIEDRNF
jgi:hypothetical protein